MASENNGSFLSFSLVLMHLFFFLTLLHWLGPPTSMLNRSSDGGHLRFLSQGEILRIPILI